MSVFLVIAALLGGFVGIFCLTQATMGVGFICGGCLLAILARIAQAYEQHQELIQKVDPKNKNIESLNK